MAVINLQTEIQPGKIRNPYLEQQMKQIQDRLNEIGNLVVGEAPVALASGSYNLYTLAHVPLTGTVQLYNDGLRVDPTTYTVSGAVLTILTADITGLVLVDYRWGV